MGHWAVQANIVFVVTPRGDAELKSPGMVNWDAH